MGFTRAAPKDEVWTRVFHELRLLGSYSAHDACSAPTNDVIGRVRRFSSNRQNQSWNVVEEFWLYILLAGLSSSSCLSLSSCRLFPEFGEYVLRAAGRTFFLVSVTPSLIWMSLPISARQEVRFLW